MKFFSLVKYFLAVLFILTCAVVMAQPTGGGPGGGAPPIPLTGLEWLLAAGGIYGAKKIYDSSKKKSN